jgi:DNA-binding response OmpR family regulator
VIADRRSTRGAESEMPMIRIATIGISEDDADRILAALRARWPRLEASAFSRAAAGEIDLVLVGGRAPALRRRVDRVRSNADVAVIVLSERPSERELVRLLDAGADDYLALGTSPQLLGDRVAAVLRRAPVRRLAR